MSSSYKKTQELINKCIDFTDTDILNAKYDSKLINNYIYNGENIDCIEFQALYRAVISKNKLNKKKKSN